MKRVLTCAGGLLLSFVCVSAVYAGAIDNKTNWSAEYIRTLNRNAATDYADIAAYNPAGTVKLHEGLTINGSAQYLGKDYSNSVTLGSTTKYSSDEPSVVPSLFAVYNEGLLSIFGAVTVVGGGGKVDFSQGNASTVGIAYELLGGPYCPYNTGTCVGFTSQNLTAESHYLSYTLGTAFNVHDIFSFSVGLRYVDAYKELKASVTLTDGADPYPLPVSFEQDADGWGGIFGVNIAPNDKLNIAMRYETKVDLEFEATVPVGLGAAILAGLDTPVINGVSNSRDLPALFALGVSYWLTPQLRVETNFTHYMNESADWGGTEDLVDDGFDVGIALEYHFNESFLASFGYLRTETGIDPENMLPENPELNANTIGGGIAYAITESFHTNLALGYVFYDDNSYTDAPVTIKYEKEIVFVALGMEYRF